jgi:hypothetical protein
MSFISVQIRAKEQAKELERKAKHALDSLGNGSVSERAMNSRMIELAKALSAWVQKTSTPYWCFLIVVLSKVSSSAKARQSL